MNPTFREAVDHICKSIQNSLPETNGKDMAKTVKKIVKSDQVFVYGAGRSGLVGRTFAMRMMQLGLRSFFIGETITPAVRDNDCVVFVSKTGETQTAIQAAKVVYERTEADIIVLTGSPESTLAGYADILMHLKIPRSEKDSTLAPLGTIFEDAAMIFLDGLVAVLLEELGESEDEMKDRHPIMV